MNTVEALLAGRVTRQATKMQAMTTTMVPTTRPMLSESHTNGTLAAEVVEAGAAVVAADTAPRASCSTRTIITDDGRCQNAPVRAVILAREAGHARSVGRRRKVKQVQTGPS